MNQTPRYHYAKVQYEPGMWKHDIVKIIGYRVWLFGHDTPSTIYKDGTTSSWIEILGPVPFEFGEK
jgi:hypothetical protein